MTNEQKLYAFPRIKEVQLRSFSLYSLQPNVNVKFDSGVLCLVGANGIGKSTLLATINYALTGAVPEPSRKLLTNQDYFKDASKYSNSFFEGRIGENDRLDAAVTVEFLIGNDKYKITRAIFNQNDLQVFEINDIPQGEEHGLATSEKRAGIYKDKLTTAIGLTSFEQFVFLQHFILTFDEARHLLFWDKEAISQALFLCFGGDPQEAAKADSLFREAEKAGSRGRNAQFQANNIRKKIETIKTVSDNGVDTLNSDVEQLNQEYKELEDTIQNLKEEYENHKTANYNAEIDVAQLSASLAGLKAAYAEVFNRLIHGSSPNNLHPLIVRAINNKVCGVCDAEGDEVVKTIQKKIDSNVCPLCESAFQESNNSDTAKIELAALDSEIGELRDKLDEAVKKQQRLKHEFDEVNQRLLQNSEKLESFKNINQDAVEYLLAQRAIKTGPVAQKLENLTVTMVESLTEKDREYAKRDQLREELRALQKKLTARYAHAESDFVPRFRKLAKLFLGMDLDITLEILNPVGIKLVVELKGGARSDQNQMSESQRFFVDIALRMALAQQMSRSDSKASLIIDTPEGSLDIAYEDRAGSMFAAFVKEGYDILMTANINSSKLLKTLAEKCGYAYMDMLLMTKWTELSEVQQTAQSLFDNAIKEIQESLSLGPSESK